jgi:sugar (pentulose or hexulose) kinase
MKHFIGIDVGSQGVRIVAIDEIGKIVSTAERKWAITNLGNSEHEQDSNHWWKCITNQCCSNFRDFIAFGQKSRATLSSHDVE